MHKCQVFYGLWQNNQLPISLEYRAGVSSTLGTVDRIGEGQPQSQMKYFP